MKQLLLLCIFISIVSCNSAKQSKLKYSANSKALIHYQQGWVQIMDEGRYGEAERSYRKALKNDPEFLIGKSVLARLTLDLEERLALYKDLQEGMSKINGDELLILEVYTAFVNYTNLRDQKSPDAKATIQEALVLAEKNLKKIVQKYPNEIYLKAEYIEMLHSLYGPKQALDSLNSLTTSVQKENPFLLGFSASMNAEVEAFDIAIKNANRLKEVINDSTQPKTFAVLADVYFQKGDLEVAKSYADKANELDPRNLDASRLKQKIDNAIGSD